jgi:hypothetical protein
VNYERKFYFHPCFWKSVPPLPNTLFSRSSMAVTLKLTNASQWLIRNTERNNSVWVRFGKSAYPSTTDATVLEGGERFPKLRKRKQWTATAGFRFVGPTALGQWFPKCGARPPGGARDVQRKKKWTKFAFSNCQWTLFARDVSPGSYYEFHHTMNIF